MTTTQAALLDTLPRWLALRSDGVVRLLPVIPPSTGPDVFVKLQDVAAALRAAEAAQPERNADAMAERAQQMAEDWHEGVESSKVIEWANKAAGLLLSFAQAPQPAPIAAQAGERAWLVELSIPGHAPQWWGFSHSPRSRGEWCADSNSAVRFARRLDAERMRLHIIAAFGFSGQHSYERNVRVTEHEWGSVAAQAEPAQAPLTDEQIDTLRGLDTASRVRFYEHDFYVLSNFSAFNLERDGLTFPTSEHAYHYEKFATDEMGPRSDVGYEVMTAPSAHEAFKIAERNKHLRRPDWDAVKVGIMLDILRAKAEQHEYVRRKLLETGTRELVEDSWRDDFWGWGPNRDGKNVLGVLWMQVRAELRDGAHGIGTHAPASTRPADASISGQRVDVVPSDDDESGFPCPNCQGSGVITVMSDNGPDAHEVEECCPHCDGRGSLDAAYEGAVKLLKAQRAETLKLSGKLWGLKHSREAREAFLLEVGEDLARWHDPIGYWKDFAARKAPAAAPQAPAEQPKPIGKFAVGLCDIACHNSGDTTAYLFSDGKLVEVKPGEACYSTPVAPAEPAAQAVGRVRIDSGEVHITPMVRDPEQSPLRDGQMVYATPAAREAGTTAGN